MKKVILLMIMVILIFSIVGCRKKPGNDYDSEIGTALNVVKEAWIKYYSNFDMEPYLEIKNTRIIFIKDNAVDEYDKFAEYDYIVEFILFTNIFGSSPYYMEVTESVVVYKDGRTELQRENPLKVYRSIMYKTNYSDIIKAVVDLGSEYNQVLELN